MGISNQKQYQFRLSREAAAYFDRQCTKYQWAAPQTATVAFLLLERIQKAASAFQVGIDTCSGEKMALFRLPSGELETLDGPDAEGFALWIIEEIQKGMVGAFCPEDPEDPEDTFFKTLDYDYPDSAVGAAMMALDGVKGAQEFEKEGTQ